jgi:hypothetical protein
MKGYGHMEGNMGNLECEKNSLDKKLFLDLQGWYIWSKNGDFRPKMTFSWIVKANMHMKGIWKVIWVIWNVKNNFGGKAIFRFVRVVYWCKKWRFQAKNDIFMDCESKNAYEGLSLGIWMVIWVIRNVKNLFWKKAIFRFVRVVYLGKKWRL